MEFKFSREFNEKTCNFVCIALDKTYYIWIGDENLEMKNIAVGFNSSSSTLVNGSLENIGESMAKKLCTLQLT